MGYFLLYGSAHGGRQGDAQPAGVHHWLATAIRELDMLIAETTGHDAFIRQTDAANPEVVFVRSASSSTLIDILDQDQELGEGVDAIDEAIRLIV